MTNEQRQEWLDRRKWIISEQLDTDKTGNMLYCEYCDKIKYSNHSCSIDQQEREQTCMCAKAYNRIYR